MTENHLADLPPEERPLVTFALFAYNQERFIREAVEGALSQTYSPLQIILSDDCSTDRTFEIMQEMVEGYSGPHEILLNKNEENLGVSNHVNKLTQIAKGQLIVAAAGDDISLPDRVDVIVRAWIVNDKPVALCSNAIYIDEAGETLSKGFGWWPAGLPEEHEAVEVSLIRFLFKEECGLYGCAEAWSKALFDYFGPLPSELLGEDPALSFRAWLMDRIVFVPDHLVLYRVHDRNIWGRRFIVDRSIEGFKLQEKRREQLTRGKLGILKSYLDDLKLAHDRGKVSSSLNAKLSKEISRQMEVAKVRGHWWSKSVTWRFATGLRLLAANGGLSDFAWGAQRVMPFRAFLKLRTSLSRMRNWMRNTRL